MTELLPVLPAAGAAISAQHVEGWERHVIQNVGEVDAIDHLTEWLAQASALEAYLRSRGLQRPMLGAQRRIEGRIGQMLDMSETGNPRHAETLPKTRQINDDQRSQFRVLGVALSGQPHPETGQRFTPDLEEWRKSRRALVSLVRHELGLMPETPPLPDGQFSCVVADPPWKLDTGPDVEKLRNELAEAAS